MSKVKIYLAGCEGFYVRNYPDSDYYLGWRRQAKDWLEKMSDNADIINPCDYYDYKESYQKSESEVRRFLLHKVHTSDVILVNLDHIKDSVGTLNEIFVANEHDIPVVGFYEFANDDSPKYDNRYLSEPWIIDACQRIEDDETSALEDALFYILNYYLN